jgi:signal transduction histidine kinase
MDDDGVLSRDGRWARRALHVLDGGEVLARACAMAVPLHADACVIDDRSAGARRVVAATLRSVEVACRELPPLELIAGESLGPVLVDLDNETFARLGLGVMAILPVTSADGRLGWFGFIASNTFRYGGERLESLRALVEDAGVALANARRHEELARNSAGAIAHEIKIPIAVLRLQLELLARRVDHADGTGRLVRTAERQLRRLSAIVDSLLGERTHDRALEPVSLAAIVREIAELMHQASDRRILVTSSTDAVVDGDRTHLELLLTNLVDNALKYSEGDVEVGVETFGERAELVVRDRGIGMPDELVDRVGERGVRGSRASALASGQGLGLHLCREIIAAHRGDLRFERRGGGGTIVRARLPLITRTGGVA